MDTEFRFQKGAKFADLLFSSVEKPTFVTLIEADETGRNVGTLLARWAGGIKMTSRAGVFSPWKAFTLLAMADTLGFSATPLEGFPEGCQFMGGVREHRQISALSGWNQKVDLMLALLLQYSLTHDVVFHHAGYSFKSPEAAQDAVTLALEKYTRALRKPAEDHMRNYFAFSTDLSLPGKFWIEYQIWEENLPRNGIHFDVATPDPLELLDYISSHSRSEKVIWGDDGPNSPVGKVFAIEDDNLEIAVMARKEWTDVQDW